MPYRTLVTLTDQHRTFAALTGVKDCSLRAQAYPPHYSTGTVVCLSYRVDWRILKGKGDLNPLSPLVGSHLAMGLLDFSAN